MNLRTLLRLVAGTGLLAALAVLALLLRLADTESARARVQDRAQQATHATAALLVLAQEYAEHGESRAADQWHQRRQVLQEALPAPESADDPALRELRDLSAELPKLFNTLASLAGGSSDFDVRRRQLLTDQLLSSSQSMADHAYRWYQDTAAKRDAARQRFKVLAVGMPLLMAGILASLAIVVSRRVLGPLGRLKAGAEAVAGGDLSTRVRYGRNDELGVVARRFDEMTEQLRGRTEALHRSEGQLRAVADNLPALIAYVDRSQTYRFANAHHWTLLGIDPEQLLGMTVEQALGEAAYTRLLPRMRAALAGKRQQFEWNGFLQAPGRHFLADYCPDMAADGSVSGFYVMVSEITERKEAELARTQSEERLQSILRHAPDAFVGIDAQSCITEWNEEAERVFGWTRQDVLGHSLADVLIPEGLRDAHNQGFSRFVHTGEGPVVNRRLELQALHMSGRLIPVELSVGAVREGEHWVANAFLRDITERKAAEQALRASEKRLQEITDNVPVLISYVDKAHTLKFSNRMFRTSLGLTGKAAEMPVRQAVGDLLYEQGVPLITAALGGQRVEFETRLGEGATHRVLHTIFVPDVAPDGEVLGLYSLGTDITRVKEVERKLSALARQDTLTGLANRLQFNEQLPVALARASRKGDGMALLFLDIDHFKQINDTQGHAGGDAVLKEFGERVKGSIRVTDTVARLAGDEFVVVLEGLKAAEEVELVAAKVVEAVRRPMTVDGSAMTVTTSVGGCYLPPGTRAPSAEALLNAADGALYEAKRLGRNTYRIAGLQVGR